MRRAFLFLAALLLAGSARAGTFYISSSLGSDSRSSTQAQSKTTPWAHAPGMKNWTGTYTPVAGDRFIFYGGDTWTIASFQWHITSSGNSSQQIYFGVDPTWFNAGVCGAVWCRPIFDFQNTIVSSSGGVSAVGVWISGNYITLDNIEFLHFELPNANLRSQFRADTIHGPDTGSNTLAYGEIIENCLFKDWGMEGTVAPGTSADTGGAGSIGGFLDDGTTHGLQLLNNTFDDQNGSCGSPTTGCYTGGGIAAGYITKNNICRYANNCFALFVPGGLFEANVIHDMYLSTDQAGGSDSGNHENQIYGKCWGYLIGNLVYATPAGATLQLDPASNCQIAGQTFYTANNVFDLTGSYSQCWVDRGNWSFYHYNDTCKTPGSATYMTRSEVGSGCPTDIHIINAHVVLDSYAGTTAPQTTSSTGASITAFANVDSGCTTAVSVTTSVAQSTAGANAQGYSLSNGWQPTSGSNATVGKGTNETALCTGLLAPLCQALNYANLTLPGTTRPASGAWDAGAYQFGVPVLHPAVPPLNLMLSAH